MPNSKIILVSNINLDKSYTNVLSYSENQMLSLCNTNKVAESNTFSFIRDRGTIQTNFTYSQALQSNYVAFQNPDYSNKWFFAFIDKVIYKGNYNTEIEYTIDSWSTWFSYWTKKNCYVIRQHVNDDTIGLNTVNENLDIGDVIEEYETEDISYSEYYWIAITSGYNPSTQEQFDGITVYNKQVYGKQVFLINGASFSDMCINLGLFIIKTNADGYADAIDNIFIVPDALITVADLNEKTTTVGGHTCTFYTLDYSNTIKSFNTTISKRHTFTGFTPKNNKCYVYPYNYLYVSNNAGNNNIYKYENFSSTNCVFRNELVLSVGCSGQLVPLSYQNMARNDDDAIPLCKYPTCSWSSDAYINWLTQNAINIPSQFTSGAMQSINSFASGESGSGVSTLASTIGGLLGQFYSAKLLPNVTKGGNTGDVNFGANRNVFTFREMRVKTEYLRIIDDYFTKFGYKINRLTSPNIVGRTYWNYLEISQDSNIGYGSVPSQYMEEINNACRRGVTIWHNHSNVGNYSLNNTISS